MRTLIGSPEVMRAQHAEIVHLSSRDNVEVQIMYGRRSTPQSWCVGDG
ncbi:Scr1 family TA system antitoxin-like transcriptional regulator [Streptomyces sp. NPDC050564]